MRTGKVIDRLLRFAPRVLGRKGPPKCILATSVAIDTLARFDIQAAPLAVDVWGFNPSAWDLTQEGNLDANAWRRFDAFVLSTASEGTVEPPVFGERANFPGRKWVGHLIAQVPDLAMVIDLDLHALSRPERRFVVPDSAAFEWPRGSEDRSYAVGGDCHLRYRLRADNTWMGSPDWRSAWQRRPFIDRIERAIRAGHV